MSRFRRRVVPGLLLFIALAGAAGAQTQPPPAPPTLAVLNFTNRNPGDGWDWLEKGLADMLITDLYASRRFDVVDRERMQLMFKEINLGKSGVVSDESAGEFGRMLNVDLTVCGSFFHDGNAIEIECHLIEPGSGRLRRVEWARGAAASSLELEKELALKVVANLNITLTESEKASLLTMRTRRVDAASELYRGIDDEDDGKYADALVKVRRAIKADPAFDRARLELGNIYRTILEFQHADLEYVSLAGQLPQSSFADDALFAHAKLLEKFLGGSDEQIIAAYDQVATLCPEGDMSLMARYRAGMMAYLRGDTEKSLRIFRGLDQVTSYQWGYGYGWTGTFARKLVSMMEAEQSGQPAPESSAGTAAHRAIPWVYFDEDKWPSAMPAEGEEVFTLPEAEGGVYYPCLTQDRSGRYYLVYNDQCGTRLWARVGGDADLWMSTSPDGRSWSTPRRLPVSSDCNDLQPWLLVDRENRLHLYWTSQRKGQKTFEVMTAVSRDGENWTMPRSCRLQFFYFPGKEPPKHISTSLGCIGPRVIMTRDGSFRMVYQSFCGEPSSWMHDSGRAAIADSEDGITWTGFRKIEGGGGTGPYSIMADGGALRCVAMALSQLWTGCSTDDGRSWDTVRGGENMTGKLNWPSACLGPDGQILMAFAFTNKGVHLTQSLDGKSWADTKKVGCRDGNPGAPFLFSDDKKQLWVVLASHDDTLRRRAIQLTRLPVPKW